MAFDDALADRIRRCLARKGVAEKKLFGCACFLLDGNVLVCVWKKSLVARVGPITLRPRDPDDPFGALVRAIVYQQLAGPAARAIHGRLRTTVGEALTPATVATTPDAALRAVGLSANKLASLRDLCAKVLDGTVVLTRTSERSDEELISRLGTVRGIGRWTPRCT